MIKLSLSILAPLAVVASVAAVTCGLAGCHLLTATQVTGVNAVVGAGCALAEGVPLPPVLAPFAPLEPVACAGLESLLAAELTKLAPPVDAGAGLGVASAAIVSRQGPLHPVYHDGQLCGYARVTQ